MTLEIIIAVILVACLAGFSGNLLARDLAVERIGEPIRTFFEVRWPGSLVAYLINCQKCLSHWFTVPVFLVTTLVCIDFGEMSLLQSGVLVAAGTMASIRVAVLLAFQQSTGDE
jgi:hypothetical protein